MTPQADWVKEFAMKFCGTDDGVLYNLDVSSAKKTNAKKLIDFISKVESLAQQRTEKKWVEAVVKQPPIFLKNNIVDLIESDHYRIVRRVRCVEILREMGKTKEADKLLKETRELSDLLK